MMTDSRSPVPEPSITDSSELQSVTPVSSIALSPLVEAVYVPCPSGNSVAVVVCARAVPPPLTTSAASAAVRPTTERTAARRPRRCPLPPPRLVCFGFSASLARSPLHVVPPGFHACRENSRTQREAGPEPYSSADHAPPSSCARNLSPCFAERSAALRSPSGLPSPAREVHVGRIIVEIQGYRKSQPSPSVRRIWPILVTANITQFEALSTSSKLHCHRRSETHACRCR